MSATTDRELLLSKVQLSIANKACKSTNYKTIGKCTDDLEFDIVVLRNFEFLLCEKDMDCDEVDCVECFLQKYLN